MVAKRNLRITWSLLAVGCICHVACYGAEQAATTGAAAEKAVGKGGAVAPYLADLTAAAESMQEAFNKGQTDALVAAFLPDGEVVDEQGNLYHGQAEIQALLQAFFEKYPGAKTSIEIESIRPVGPLFIMEGVRTTVTQDGAATAVMRFVAQWIQRDKQYHLVMMQDFHESLATSPNDMLQSLAWMIGEWVNEGTDGRVKLSYQWSDDQNFILGDITMTSPDKVVTKSSQRIGWDGRLGKVHSWTFDADGGFGEGIWTPTEKGWLIHSTAHGPDGSAGSARLELAVQSADRYVVKGSDRVTDNVPDDDFEVTIVRAPATDR